MTLKFGRFGEMKLIAGLVVLCAVVTGAFGFFAWRDAATVTATRDEIAGLQGQIDAAARKKASIPALERDVIVLRENVDQYVKILPDDREINDFVNKINAFADQAEVVVTKLDDIDRAKHGRQTNSKGKEAFEKVEYKIQLSGSIDGLLTFMGLFENFDRFVRISSYEIKTGKDDAERDSKGRIKHDVNLQLETFVYNGGEGPAGRAKIRDYETKRDELKAEIARARQDIEIEKYSRRFDRVRRDPFIDPRAQSTESDPQALTKQKTILDKLVGRFDEIEKALATESAEQDLIKRSEMRRVNDGMLLDFSKEVVAAKSGGLITAAPLLEVFQKKILDHIDSIVQSRGLSGNEAGISIADLERVRGKLTDLFEKGDYKVVLEQFELLERTSDLGSAQPQAAPVLAEIQRIRDAAKTHVEFASRPISIEGLVYRPEGSAVIINGSVLSAGDSVDPEVVVSRIDEGEVEFTYKNIKIVRLVR
ncbi:MAG: type 4a pilus biogenesis protein PilO [Planctomycetes bacterium]|nr:type 4a pilus biogenesis protein PilO [Planctomycetota bacterium]MBI3845059.1 type 4a pilus biogenesis protein PilO [Planctomycetota bacterium]